MKAGRLPAWVWVLGTWTLLVAVAALLERGWGLSVETCLFHRLTGFPCPTCGSTRSVLALLGGDWVASLRASPLLWMVGLTLVAVAIAHGWRGRNRLAPVEWNRPWLLALGLLLLLANWIWVLATQ